MAEHGAHLTSSGVDTEVQPSIFEVLAQQSLSSTLHPAIGHAVKVFAEKFPEQLGPVLQYYDEIYLLFDTVVQSHYLRKYGGSFAENFYGLKRVASGQSSPDVISNRLRLRALSCLILIPYAKQKLQSLYENMLYNYGEAGRSAFLQRNASLRQRLVSLYMLCFPYVSSVWELLTLTYQVRYMLRRSRWHSPSMHLSGTELRHCDGDEESTGSGLSWGLGSSWPEMSLSDRLVHVFKLSMNVGAVAVSSSLSVGVFFLQFLDWWYSSDSSATSLTALPIPRPPTCDRLKDVATTACPLCRRDRVNSTALAVSGFVFCYMCISEHISRERCCPVTGLPATQDHLVKIYQQPV